VLFGLTRSTTAADLARGCPRRVAIAGADLIEAAGLDTGHALQVLRVDGGMARNAWFAAPGRFLGIPVLHRRTAKLCSGAAFLAGLQLGIWPDLRANQALTEAGRSCAASSQGIAGPAPGPVARAQ